ncbi:MAG: hypothetical protein JXA69_13400 [Phycisphaerae bacterium]|nr:hypothetical protein [Phycisphaerae bacterium]
MDQANTVPRLLYRPRLALGCAGGFVLVGLWICGLPGNDVLEVAYSFPDGGGYCSVEDSGVSETIEHNGSVILPASAGGTYCCGFTFQVAMRVANSRGLLTGKSVADVRHFQKLWYGSVPGSEVRQCAMAVEDLGIGREIPLEDARPGDFMHLGNVSPCGHAVVFLDWLRDGNGEVVGVRYRSSQGKGIGDGTAIFADAWPRFSNIDPKRCAVARLNRPWWSRLLYPFFWG